MKTHVWWWLTAAVIAAQVLYYAAPRIKEWWRKLGEEPDAGDDQGYY